MENKQLEETHQLREQGQLSVQQTILSSHLLNSLRLNLLFLKTANKMHLSFNTPKLWINRIANIFKILCATIKVSPRIKLQDRLKSIICHQDLRSLRKLSRIKTCNNSKIFITYKAINWKINLCNRNQSVTKIIIPNRYQTMINNSCKILKI
jgi:hypothetical protein